ncbi:MAG: hypothetical protein A3D74_00695 [Candidatus Levybacteria bacterium RIFCSPHIGHO2_02_FULL_37_13]|nr:MAG: hypothetical protein A3D74_00695 [Candidatus Levybacteria bacterium RIFCSPHIGHO2_02_FULL_37_13]OGH30733.1 MAG: hypothetical protein A3E40_00725 [Candidatus Levybacteria bacterium RIFCSPHIGHO2_12_FULL_37_9]OGH37938.1 MAG: hypothetical protein A3B41_04990 [Candidatus Levybacteria bacterium RIFCSPLOWO2_01_FULL_37_26]
MIIYKKVIVIKKTKKSLLLKKISQWTRSIIGNNKLLSFVILVALSVRLLGLLPNEYHEDEPYVEKHSAKLFYNIITKGDFDPHDYKYGSFIYYLETIPYFIVYPFKYLLQIIQNLFFSFGNQHSVQSFQQYILNLGVSTQRDLTIFWIQRFFIAILGTFCVPLVYIITKKLFNKHTALIAAAAIGVFPLHVRESHYIVPDIAITFFISLAMLFMVNLFQKGKLKWYFLSGITIGFSTTLKYFPLAILAYPFAILLQKQKNMNWIMYSGIGIFSIVIGLFIGVPFLFLNFEDNRSIFQENMAYNLLWYNTPFTTLLSSLGPFFSSGGKTPLPSLETFIPTHFTPFYISLLFFRGLGIIPTIMCLFGIIIIMIKYSKLLIFLAIIPVFVFIYSSFYVPAVYERQADPMLPFLSIFIGVSLYFIWDFLKKRDTPKKEIIYTTLLMLTFYYPVTESFASSWACGQKSVFEQSPTWIESNIPPSARVAFQTHLPFPASYSNLIQMLPNKNFSIEEIRKDKASYAFINYTTLQVKHLNPFLVDFFTPPDDLYKNSFIMLSLYEYQTRAVLMKKISKPNMCNQPTLLYYKLPKPISNVNHVLKKFNFNNQKGMDFWHLQEYAKEPKIAKMIYSPTEGNDQAGAMSYIWTSRPAYTMPRIVSQKIKAKENDIYTFSAWAKYSEELTELEKDGFLRVDFYDDWNKPIVLPGNTVALSPRTYGKPNFRKLQITGKAPPNTKSVVFSLQVNGSKPEGSFYFDDIEIRGPK